jgi:YVTN family beta-propeller protein
MKLAALLTMVCLAATLHAQPSPNQSSPTQPSPTQTGASLLVLSKHDHTLAIVDPSTLKVIARVPVGNDPHEVIASTDGSTAYVSNYGFGAYNTLAVVDLVHQSALAPIDLGPLRGPHGLTFVGGKTWFTAEAAKAIGRYDPATQKVDWILGTGQNRTHMIYVFPDVNPDVQRILTTNVGSGTVSLIQKEPVRMPGPPPGMRPPGALGSAPPPPPGGATQRVDWNQTVIPVGRGAEGFDVSPDQREAWVANARDGTISVIDLAAKEVVDTVAANVPSANRLKFTPDGRRVLVSSLSGPDLVILDSATRREVKRLPIGHGAAGIEIEPGGARAFVACTPDNYVTVIDLHSLAVVGKIDAGPEPDGLAWAVRRSTP